MRGCGLLIHTRHREPFTGGVQWLSGTDRGVAAVVPCRCEAGAFTGCTGLLRRLDDAEVAYLRKRGHTSPTLGFTLCTRCDRENSLAGLMAGTMFCSVALGAMALSLWRHFRARALTSRT